MNILKDKKFKIALGTVLGIAICIGGYYGYAEYQEKDSIKTSNANYKDKFNTPGRSCLCDLSKIKDAASKDEEKPEDTPEEPVQETPAPVESYYGQQNSNGQYLWELPTVASYPDLGDRQGLSVEVSTGEQRVRIYKNGQLLTTFVASTGTSVTPTILGNFALGSRGLSFNGPDGGAKYWVSFYQDYLFHSIPTDPYGNHEIAEGAKLGSPASHGCVRMSVADAKWFYENMPSGTPVTVY